jgi:hypothetical protein
MATKKTTKTAAVAPKTETKVETKVEATAKTEDTTAKKTATKTTEKKATAKKTTTKTATAKKNELFIQFSGFEFSHEELLEKVKADYIAQTGKKTISSTKLYVKPEDMKVYYVVNEKFMGDVYLG